MRAYKRFDQRGFTLVELMIVVAIIGVLAALAIYGVKTYLASAKTAEAKNGIGAISRGAAAAYERENTPAQILGDGASSNATSHSLCVSATPVPAVPPPGKKYQPSTLPSVDFNTTAWQCLRFNMDQPMYYSYNYTTGTATVAGDGSDSTGFEAIAMGDLNGDGAVFSTFARAANINGTSKALMMATQIAVINEFE